MLNLNHLACHRDRLKVCMLGGRVSVRHLALASPVDLVEEDLDMARNYPSPVDLDRSVDPVEMARVVVPDLSWAHGKMENPHRALSSSRANAGMESFASFRISTSRAMTVSEASTSILAVSDGARTDR